MAQNNEYTWVKLSRQIIRDENLNYISECLPEHLKAAPLLFYTVAISLADEDGTFDLEDGLIFSRLMKIGSPEDVFTIANLFMQRRIILRQGETTTCIFTKWEYPQNQRARTLQERRDIVNAKIQQRQQPNNLFQRPEKSETITVNFKKFCSHDDKNAENVVKKDRQIDRETDTQIPREIREIPRQTEDRQIDIDIQKDTHTDRALPMQQQGMVRASEILDKQQQKQEQQEQTALMNQADAPESSEQVAAIENGDEKETGAFPVLDEFFAKNCQGTYDPEHIVELVLRINELSDETNPPEVVAMVMCNQFKKMHDSEGYYHNYPITPEYMLKEGAWNHILAASSRILMNNKSNQEAWKAQVREESEYQQEKETVGDYMQQRYLDLNVDPSSPNKAMDLLRASAEAQRRPKEDSAG